MKQFIGVFTAIIALPFIANAQMAGGAQAGSYQGIISGTYAFHDSYNPSIIQNGQTLTCTASGTSYQWYLNDTLKTQYTTKLITIKPTEGGIWKVVVANALGCTTTSPGLNVGGSGVMESPEISSVLTLLPASPNPANQFTTLLYGLSKDEDVELVVWDVLGHEVHRESFGRQANGEHEVVVSTANFSSGVYSYIIVAGGVSMEQSFVVSK